MMFARPMRNHRRHEQGDDDGRKSPAWTDAQVPGQGQVQAPDGQDGDQRLPARLRVPPIVRPARKRL